MVGEEEGKVNLDHGYDAVRERVLDGGQGWMTTSPWAPMGPLYDLVSKHHGDPGEVLVVRFPGPAMWPWWWSPERCERARLRDLKGEHDETKGTYRTDVLGEWGTPETAMFSEVELGAVLRDGELEPVDGETYIAAMDPSGRGGNAWTLVIGGIRRQTGKPTLYAARQWFPNKDFTESAVLRAMRPLLEKYRVSWAMTDQYASGFVQSLAQEVGIYLTEVRAKPWTSQNKLDAFDSLRVMVREQRVELVAAENVRQDLLRVRRVLTPNGARINFPETADGRHCDYAPAIAMWATTPMEPATPDDSRVQQWQREEERMEDDENYDDNPWTFRGRRRR